MHITCYIRSSYVSHQGKESLIIEYSGMRDLI